MTQLASINSVSVAAMQARIDTYKNNPSLILRAAIDTLDEVLDGTMELIDVTNPWVFLMENSAVNTAAAVNENMALLRKQYPSLAQTEEDLYLHMSDKDYINRFSAPAETPYTFMIQVDQLVARMVRDTTENCYKATIPRETQVVVDGLYFTLQYPINIRKFDNGVVQVSYDTEIISPIQTLGTNIIPAVVRTIDSGVQWLTFTIPLLQIRISSVHDTIQKGRFFQLDIPLSDQFFFIRSFYRNTATANLWTELKTTHTDMVFDANDPTLLVKASSTKAQVSLPILYQNLGTITGEIRIDVYTTRGSVTLNLDNYAADAHELSLRALDEDRDLGVFVNVFNSVSIRAYSASTVTGGTDGVTFDVLRERVINNSVGEQTIPITNVEVQAFVENRGFDLVRNVDVVTNRIFLATQKLPAPSNTKLTTSANIGIATFIANMDQLKNHEYVMDHDGRWTLLPKNLYQSVNSIIKILSPAEIDAINAMGINTKVALLNSNQYLYTPFHYILDNTSSEFAIRAYYLDKPSASELNFIRQNQSLQLVVNTDTYHLSRTDGGYQLEVITKSGAFYKDLPDGTVQAQLAISPSGDSTLTYIMGTQVGLTDAGERIYHFDILTNYDVDGDDLICVTNTQVIGSSNMKIWVDLETKIQLFYCTTSIIQGYVPDATDALIGKFLLPSGVAGITHEILDLHLGSALKNLWSRSRSLATGVTYKKHTLDVPLVYDRIVYKIDPVTGSIFDQDMNYVIEHALGDPVLDVNGDPVYKYRIGDVVLDNSGNPVTEESTAVNKEMDIMFVDGRHYFVNDASYLSYNQELVTVIETWVVEDLEVIQERLLEQSRIFFYPKNQLGSVKILEEDERFDYIQAEQSFVLDLYVPPIIHRDSVIRSQLETKTIALLDSYISGVAVNLTEITVALKAIYGTSVTSFDISGLGGSKNFQLVQLASEENRLCLKRILSIQQDGTLILKEDVTVNYHKTR